MEAKDQPDARYLVGARNAGYLPDNSPAIQRLSVTLYRALARGRPVAPSDLAALLESGEPEIETLLSALPPSVLDRDDDGAITAFVGLSLSPTRHRFELGAQTLFTWCVLDALFLPEILDQEARVATHCPASDTPIVLRVAPDRVVDVEPPGAVMSMVAPEIAACQDDLRGAFCSHVSFFAGRDSFKRWAKDRSGTRCVTIAEAFDLGQ
jgi:alkylmercury lyase